MKHFVTLLLVLISGELLWAQPTVADTVELDSKITAVTVYPSRAQVTRSANREFAAGEYTLVFENIPISTQRESFRTSATGPQGLTLLGMNYREEFHTESTNQKVAELERQLKQLKNEVKRAIEDRLDVFNQQKVFLQTLTKTATKTLTEQVDNGGIKIDQWRSAYAFVSEEVRSTNDSIRIVSGELEKVEVESEKLQNELNQLQTSLTNSSWTVEVDVKLKKAGAVDVTLQYVIPDATWSPLYDARMNNKSGEVELSYFARVAQRTGEDWTDVTLSLSTATPSSGTGPGDLANWTLVATPPHDSYIQVRGALAGAIDYIIDGEATLDDVIFPMKRKSQADVIGASVTAGGYSTTFNIARKESVASGGRAIQVSINTWLLQSDIELICRPRNRQGVYRLVTLTNQDEAPLMPGAVSIFSGADLLGNTQISELVTPSQKFELPFGLENSIAVERKIDSYKKNKNSTRIRIDQTIKITLTNNGTKSADLTLEEPLPVSQDNQIRVKTRGIKPEPLPSEDKKKVVWKITLAPGEEKDFLIPLRIEYPPTITVVGL